MPWWKGVWVHTGNLGSILFYYFCKNGSSYKEMLEFLIKVINYRWLHDSCFQNVFNIKSPAEISSCTLFMYQADKNDIYHKISVWLKDNTPLSLHLYPILWTQFIETNLDDASFIPCGLNLAGITLLSLDNYYRNTGSPLILSEEKLY